MADAVKRAQDYVVPVRVFASRGKEAYPYDNPPTFHVLKFLSGGYHLTLVEKGWRGDDSASGCFFNPDELKTKEGLLLRLHNEIRRLELRYHLPEERYKLVVLEEQWPRESKEETKNIRQALEKLL